MESFGLAEKLCRSAAAADTGKRVGLKNSYIVLDESGAYPVDPRTVDTLGFGFDYYMEVFRIVENKYDVSGIDFFISIRCPYRLPKYGQTVVLVVLGDEWYQFRPYFYRIRCVFKCRTRGPQLDNIKGDAQQVLSTVVQYGIKFIWHTWSRVHSRMRTRGGYAYVYPLPLGYFHNPNAMLTKAEKADLGFSFAGSVEYVVAGSLNPRRLLPPPKLLSRRRMCAAADAYLKKHPNSGVLKETAHFMESIANREEYLSLLNRSKIILCPRGEGTETYRFFEATAAGRAIVCESLPKVWYYEDHPARIVNDWRELERTLDDLLNDEVNLAAIMKRTAKYWRDRLSEPAVARHIAETVLAQDQLRQF